MLSKVEKLLIPLDSSWGECSYIITTEFSSSNPASQIPARRNSFCSPFMDGKVSSAVAGPHASFQQLPLFVRKLLLSRVRLPSLAVSRWHRQRSKTQSVYSFKKVTPAPKTHSHLTGAAGLGGRPLGVQAAGSWTRAQLGAGSECSPQGDTFLKPKAHQG